MKRVALVLLLGASLLATPIERAFGGQLEDAIAAYNDGNYSTALQALQRLTEQGNPDATCTLGVMYTKGQGVSQDYARALELFNRAISLGSAEAEAELGYMYQSGFGVPQNYDEAIARYRDAVQRGSARGENYLGEAYVAGEGVVKDYDQARQLFLDAAQKGLTVALVNLGNLYYLGRGVPKDLPTALRYYEAAAAKNSPEAQNNLGLMYQKGIGVLQNNDTAIRMFERAALLGESSGAYNAGWAFENGIGMPPDLLQAYAWYDIGAHEGGTFSSQRRDIVSTQLTADQVQQARQAETSILSEGTAKPASQEETAAASAQSSNAPTQAASQTSVASQQTARIVATGSGFYVSNSALILTNYHVIQNCTAVSVLGATASVVGVDQQNDLALLSTSPRSGEVATLRGDPPVRAGERVVVVGFPLTGLLAEQANVTTGDVSSLAGINNDSRYLQITAPVQPGNSGGPLFDASGNVIGVVSAKLDAVSVRPGTLGVG
jgi:TPR repeat protein